MSKEKTITAYVTFKDGKWISRFSDAKGLFQIYLLSQVLKKIPIGTTLAALASGRNLYRIKINYVKRMFETNYICEFSPFIK